MDLLLLLTILVTLLFLSISVFQVFLALGFPLGEFAMGGFYKILPLKLRIVSMCNAIILLMMNVLFLQYTGVINGFGFLPVPIFVWLITGFLFLNTVANYFSKSDKEKKVMTPLSALMCVCCLLIILL
ncbi:hypothetical protein ACE1TH_11090 [Shouchella sp. JSM 1781072]|uniref:hypothetical protein n=1 Tax=Bacillaceae TaxID=186817 RepID=UPI000C08970E|nr:hypothetical protein [Bacillus sp. Marseille-P3800]